MPKRTDNPGGSAQRDQLIALINKATLEHTRRLAELARKAEDLRGAIESLQELQKKTIPPPANPR